VKGAAACGHPVTLDAALGVLGAGGNAFDAVAASLATSFAAEPLLSSPGGGGFLLARPAGAPPRVYDFFAQTPLGKPSPGDPEDFREVVVDFGPADQHFRIGLGSCATPGAVAGLFAVHGELGRMPFREVISHGVSAARTGVQVTAMQRYVSSVLAPIISSSPGVRELFLPAGALPEEGEIHRLPELADLLETLSIEGEDLFYRGEVAAAVDRVSREVGGHLRREDFQAYRVERRTPLEVEYRGGRIWTNPPPASGGVLVAFGLGLLAHEAGSAPPGDGRTGVAEVMRMARVLAATGEARLAEGLDDGVDVAGARAFLDPSTLARYAAEIRGHPPAPRGTTHISVVDREGNAASLSISNGEGCGWAVPGAGFMLNNMLGEADLQPRGFGLWRSGVRLTSMMAPTLLLEPGGRLVALGSGGSNRIRSAVLQVLSGILDRGLSLEESVALPRLHAEGARLEIEGGFGEGVLSALQRMWPDHRAWPGPNLFFGGVHVAAWGPRGGIGAGDPRRAGVAGVG